MTSVSGHLLNYEFVAAFRNWASCNPVSLFDAPIMKTCPTNYQKIKVIAPQVTITYIPIIIVNI